MEFKINKLVLGVLGAVTSVFLITNMVEVLDSTDIMIVQSVTGDLTVYTEPGPKWQKFGTVYTYPRQETITFQYNEDKAQDTSINMQFNDGGMAWISGSINWEMPLAHNDVLRVHRQFKSSEGVRKAAVEKMLNTATYMTGQLMNSIESASERRSELVAFVNDQAARGVYATQVREVTQKDPATGEERTYKVSEVKTGSNGLPVRQQGSLVQEFNIRLQPLSIANIMYDGKVRTQISARQEATNAVQIAVANATKARQDAITTEAQGAANAATAKWEQETIKAKEVTLAEQKRDVSKLAKEEAENYKQQQILIGQGDAERKKLTMQADGALEQKLKAYIAVQEKWADAFANSKNPLVPQISMGANGNSAVGNAASLVEMLTAKTAKDLALDLNAKQ